MFNAGKVRPVLCLARRIGGQTHPFSIAAAKKATTGVRVTVYSTSNFFKNPIFPDRHELHHSSLANLQKYLGTRLHPCIVGVRTGALPYWKGKDSLHAVVVHGFDDKHIFLNDPYFDNTEFLVPLGAFSLAWSKTGNIAITIERR